MLRVVDEMYGEKWTRSYTLTALLFHLTHHRGQMTTLLRLGGARSKDVAGRLERNGLLMVYRHQRYKKSMLN